MAKKSKHVRKFLKVAEMRLGDAHFLLTADRSIAAAYLAGYAVECSLKALILSVVHEHEQLKVIDTFRGSRAHDYDWLRLQYFERGGATVPNVIADAFVALDDWSVELRYNPVNDFPSEIEEFFAAVEAIQDWALQRIR